MAGYVIKKKKPYPITGSDGTNYLLPPKERLTADDISMVGQYDKEEDIGEKIKICKELILRYAPGLEHDPEVGDNEFSMIFADYLNTVGDHGKKTGES